MDTGRGGMHPIRAGSDTQGAGIDTQGAGIHPGAQGIGAGDGGMGGSCRGRATIGATPEGGRDGFLPADSPATPSSAA